MTTLILAKDTDRKKRKNVDRFPTFQASCFSSERHLLTQEDLNYPVRDLNLSRKQAEILGSRLKGWNILQPYIEICFFCNRQN